MSIKNIKATGKGKNVSETVYDILYTNIINLNLAPGTMISEKEISEKFQVSRTPVREAFIRLSNEALISVFPQKGSFVSKIDLSRVKEERFLRESLENSVLEILVGSCTDEGIGRLYKNLEKQKKALTDNDLIKLIDYDDQFHEIIFDEAERSMCYGVIKSFSSHYRRIRYLSMSISGVTDENIIQHSKLVKAIENGELQEARTILKKHLRKLIVEKDEICNKYSDYFEEKRVYLSDTDIFEPKHDLFNKIGNSFCINIEK